MGWSEGDHDETIPSPDPDPWDPEDQPGAAYQEAATGPDEFVEVGNDTFTAEGIVPEEIVPDGFGLTGRRVRWDPYHLRRENPYRGVRRLLVYCSGAEPDILARSQTEQAAYMSLGGTVLATGVLAATSSTFALSLAFRAPWYTVLPVGLIWGLIILNLDRWLVASFRRSETKRGNFFSVVPRVILAALFGLIIAEPMLIRIFEDEIDEKLKVLDIETRNAEVTAVDDGPTALEIEAVRQQIETELDGGDSAFSSPELSRIDEEIEQLEADRAEAQARIDDAQEEAEVARAAYVEEVRAGCVDSQEPSCRPGEGPIARSKLVDAELKETTRDRIVGEQQPIVDGFTVRLDALAVERLAVLNSNSTRIEQRDSARQDRIDRLEEDLRLLELDLENERDAAQDVEFGAGLLARSDALGVLRSESTQVRYLYWLLALLFLSIDVIPILGKFMYSVGKPKPYDLMRASIENEVFAEVAKSGLSNTIELDNLADAEDYRVRRIRKNQERLIDHAAEIQHRLAQHTLVDWELKNAPTGGMFPYQPVNPMDVQGLPERPEATGENGTPSGANPTPDEGDTSDYRWNPEYQPEADQNGGHRLPRRDVDIDLTSQQTERPRHAGTVE